MKSFYNIKISETEDELGAQDSSAPLPPLPATCPLELYQDVCTLEIYGGMHCSLEIYQDAFSQCFSRILPGRVLSRNLRGRAFRLPASSMDIELPSRVPLPEVNE